MAHKVEGRKVRYAVVGAGQIAQQAFMPGIAATTNSELSAIVTGDPRKAEALAERYGIKAYGYDELPRLIASGEADAYYVATPNERHRADSVPILEAGYHVLLEKPMATSLEDCQAIMSAQAQGGGKLMIAYRLHHEPGTVQMIDMALAGGLGETRIFTSTFSQKVSLDNHRAKMGYWSGPVPDMGTYPLNAVRNLFGLQPLEVRAIGTQRAGRVFDFDDTVSVQLLFGEGRVAHFTVSYSSAATEHLTLAGTKGSLTASPCYGYGETVGIRYTTVIDGKPETHAFEPVEQFGGETDYFSDCILKDQSPEADGQEGFFDVMVLAAIEEALRTSEPQELRPRSRIKRISTDQVRRLAPVKQPSDDDLVGVTPLSP